MDTDDQNWYPKEKIYLAKLKLLGCHPRFITGEEFASNSNMKSCIEEGQSHIYGKTTPDKDSRLSVKEQVDELINQSTDPNLLGRMWVGWAPFL